MRKTGLAKVAATALAAAMMLTACGGGADTATTAAPAAGGDAAKETEAAAAPEAGNIGKTEITFAMSGDIVALDPAGQQDTTSSVILKHVYSRLIETDDEGKLVPGYACHWTEPIYGIYVR